MSKALMNYQETAEMLSVKLGTLYAWVCERKIPHIRLGTRLIRFDRSEIERWIDNSHVEAQPRNANSKFHAGSLTSNPTTPSPTRRLP